MAKVLLRWALPMAALFVLGPAASRLVVLLHAADGSRDVTLLVNTTPILGAAVIAGIIALAIVGALPAARLFGPRAALLTAGFTLTWASWYTAPLSMLVRRAEPTSVLTTLAIEGAIVAAFGMLMLMLIFHVGARAHDPKDHLVGEGGMELRRTFTTPVGLVSMLGAAAAALLITWALAREPQRGQSIFAAFVAGIGAGAVGVWAGTFIDRDVPRGAPIVAMLLLAIVAPLIGLVSPGAGAMRDAVVTDAFLGPVRLQGLDWLIGASIGVPMGLSWVRAAIESSESHEHKPARA
ncbi:MAG: hypothetical protein R3B57_04870 [Phycisphaerales bacterium]